jgi:dihydrofolate reductase
MSLDGYIAGPNGEADWIITDPEIDFGEIFARFDTFLLGRRTFEAMGKAGQKSSPGTKTFVFSRTLRQQDFEGVTVVAEKVEEFVAALRKKKGKDIWLFGGGSLFGSLLDAGLVDTVEVAIIPVLLGEGTPLLASPAQRKKLKLTGHKIYSKTGIVSLDYLVL